MDVCFTVFFQHSTVFSFCGFYSVVFVLFTVFSPCPTPQCTLLNRCPLFEHNNPLYCGVPGSPCLGKIPSRVTQFWVNNSWLSIPPFNCPHATETSEPYVRWHATTCTLLFTSYAPFLTRCVAQVQSPTP